MVPVRGTWTPFADTDDQIAHYRLWGLIPPKSTKLRPVMVADGYLGSPEPCTVVGHQGDAWAVVQIGDGLHAIHGDYLAELQPVAYQRLPSGTCFAAVLSDYIALDIETTGFNRKNDRIIEIAAIRYQYGQEVSRFDTLVNPGIPLPPEIAKLTGITQEELNDSPRLEEIGDDFLRYVGSLPVIGHNIASFDVPFLSAQLSTEFSNPVIDTLIMASKVFELLPSHKLEALNAYLHLDSKGAHRALADVETANQLLWACLAPRRYESEIYHAFLDHLLSTPADRAPGRTPTPRRRQSTKYAKKFECAKIDIHSIVPSDDAAGVACPLQGKSIVFTGELSIPREEAYQMAVDAGAVLKSSVSKKVSYLVVGKQNLALVGSDGMSTKEARAREINLSGAAKIEIINEEQFLALIGKDGSCECPSN